MVYKKYISIHSNELKVYSRKGSAYEEARRQEDASHTVERVQSGEGHMVASIEIQQHKPFDFRIWKI